ncbi:MAG: hypothetical protein GF308_11095 [Candidatus Heimdallarchaeota archaeon]|nr:hypothetical protein [Candidatus Heimdallarchaeota archaeon]
MSEKLEKLRQKIEQHPEVMEFKQQLANELYNRISDLSGSGKSEEVEELFEEMQQLAKDHPNEETIQKYYGQTIFTVFPMFSITGTITENKQLINEFREITRKNESLMLKELLAMMLVNAMYDLSLRDQVPSIHEFALELVDLARTHHKNTKIQLASAKGLMNAVNYFIKKQDEKAAQEYFRKLLRIVKANPKEELIDTRKLAQLKDYFNMD